MGALYRIAYRIGLASYVLAVRLLAAVGHRKAQLWWRGRRGWQQRVAAWDRSKPVIWLHAASLGEFEQGRPVLEALQAQYPHCGVVVTFFSPSGYELRKAYPCTGVSYLPMDSPRAARQWLALVPVQLAIFVKYDFWHYYLQALAARRTPTLLLAACLTPDNAVLRRWLRPLYKPMLHAYSHIFCQDARTAQLLHTHLGYSHTTVCGDPRFDRVQAHAAQAQALPQVEAFLAWRWALVAGSTYSVCEQLMGEALTAHWPQDMVLLIAPHDVGHGRVQEILRRWQGQAITWSAWQAAAAAGTSPLGWRVLVIDTVGILTTLYRYGRLNYVGGALGKGGIHNLLESAVYGVPTCYGPHHHKHPEAAALVAAGGATELLHAQDLSKLLEAAEAQTPAFVQMGQEAEAFVRNGGGATGAVVSWVAQQQLL